MSDVRMDRRQFLDYLDSVHRRTQRVVECIPDDRWDWRPTPTSFSMADLVRHLAAIERFMFAEVARGRQNAYPGHGPHLARGADAVREYYAGMHDESRAMFASIPEAEYVEPVVSPSGARITLWKWLRAHLEHEAHHRGQLYLMLRMIEVPTPAVFGMTSEQLVHQVVSGQP